MQAEEHADRPPLDTAWLDALLGGSPAGVAVFDGDLRYVYVNPALERINGVPAAAHLGRTIGEVLPDVDVRLDVMRRVLADGRPRDLTASGRTWADSAVERRYWRGACHRLQEGGRVSGLMVITQEITATQIEREELLRARSYLTLLDNAAVSIGTTLDAGTTCQELADFVVPVMADVAVVELIPEEDVRTRREPPPGALRLRRAGVATVPGLADSVARFGGPGTDIDYQEDAAVPRCLAADEPVIENLYGDEQLGRSAPTPERVGAYRAIGLHSAVAVPLTARGRPLGVLSLLRAGASPPSPKAWTSSSPVRSRAGRRSTSTMPTATPTSTASPVNSSGPCSPSPGGRIPASRSRRSICPRGPGRWWAATGSTPSRCGAGAI